MTARMPLARWSLITVVFVGVATAFIAFVIWHAGNETRVESKVVTPLRTSVTIGIQISPAMAVVMVAKDKQFFDHEGLDCTLVPFSAGKFALQSFLAGSTDFAVSGEVPCCLAALQHNQLRVVTQVVERTIDEVRVVAWKDGDLVEPGKYFGARKRKLATSFGGGPEMFTYSFLQFYGIKREELEIISMKPEDMPAALESRSVDAIAIFDPFALIAEKRLGNQVQTFENAAVYSELYVLNATPEQIAKQPVVIEKVLRALVKAGSYIEEHPEDSKQVVQAYTKLDRDVIDGIWGNFVFRPALTPQLVHLFEKEVAWAKETGKVPADAPVPDFRRDLIDATLLERVAPRSVTLSK